MIILYIILCVLAAGIISVIVDNGDAFNNKLEKILLTLLWPVIFIFAFFMAFYMLGECIGRFLIKKLSTLQSN